MVDHSDLFKRREIVVGPNGYRVVELNAAEAEQIALAFQAGGEELEVTAMLCALSLRDATGQRVFANTDTMTLQRIMTDMPASRLQKIADAAMQLFEAPENP